LRELRYKYRFESLEKNLNIHAKKVVTENSFVKNQIRKISRRTEKTSYSTAQSSAPQKCIEYKTTRATDKKFSPLSRENRHRKRCADNDEEDNPA